MGSCALCKTPLPELTDEARAVMLAEFRRDFNREPTPAEFDDRICTPCYEKIMARAEAEGWEDDGGG